MSKQDLSINNIEQTVDEISPLTKEIVGIVTGCRFLNIRTEPDIDSLIMCREQALSELIIDESKSTDEWLSVCTVNGIEGYCMKKYVTIKNEEY